MDTDASFTTLPSRLLRELGVEATGKRGFLLADGRRVEMDYGQAWATIEGESVVTIVVFGEETVGMSMAKTPWALGALVVTALLIACGGREVIEIVVTATPEPSVGMASSDKAVTDTPASASVPTLQPTTPPTTSEATPRPTPEAGDQVQAERNRAAIKRYAEEEHDAATLTNVIIDCAASVGISFTDRIKAGGRAEDQMSELILAGVLDDYDVLQCTADEITQEVGDGS